MQVGFEKNSHVKLLGVTKIVKYKCDEYAVRKSVQNIINLVYHIY